jgi:hypothetical protein
MPPLASALPENTGDGYVAAAYIVFFLLLLIYVAIMALRLSHVQRDLRDLQARSSAEPTRSGAQAAPADTVGASSHADALEHPREREPA